MNTIILIPTLNPSYSLIDQVEQLQKKGFMDILIVNDGSKDSCQETFVLLEQRCKCKVIHHAINLGKGRALKTGINYFLNHYRGYEGLITVDGDGQHDVEDVYKIHQFFSSHQDALILGARDFSEKNIPFRSKFGNVITRNIFRFLIGARLNDTQTGLRAIPTEFAKKLMNVSGERFEFEMNMLIEAKRNNIEMLDVFIKTIYIEANASSHFSPIIDSIRIYSLIFKFSCISLVSYFLDISLFYFIILRIPNANNPILIATVIARMISSGFNFICNKNFVFQCRQMGNRMLIKYYILCFVQVFFSWLFVEVANQYIHMNIGFIKSLVDLCLYFLSFYVQRELIFKDAHLDRSRVC